jgi:hypothetical protein
VSLLELSPVKLGSRASYRHDDRDTLPTKRKRTSLINALTGEARRSRPLTEPDIEITQHSELVR